MVFALLNFYFALLYNITVFGVEIYEYTSSGLAYYWQVPEWALDLWHPSEKAMYPDYFAKREQWKKLRMESWDKEVGSFFCRHSPKIKCVIEF